MDQGRVFGQARVKFCRCLASVLSWYCVGPNIVCHAELTPTFNPIPNCNPVSNSFTFLSDPDQHVCEVQLVHEGMLTARKHCNAHTAYSKFRSALELLETFGLMQTPTHTDEAGMDVDTSAKELVGEELVQQRKFVQELDREYDTFLGRYQQMLGILPVVDTDDISTPEDCSTSHDSGSPDTATGSATELKAEVRRLQHENASQQKQITVQQRQIASQQQQITAQQRENISQQQQIDRILLKMKEFERNHSTSKPSH